MATLTSPGLPQVWYLTRIYSLVHYRDQWFKIHGGWGGYHSDAYLWALCLSLKSYHMPTFVFNIGGLEAQLFSVNHSVWVRVLPYSIFKESTLGQKTMNQSGTMCGFHYDYFNFLFDINLWAILTWWLSKIDYHHKSYKVGYTVVSISSAT
jgi:hypothetical protein